ncbi:MAG: hypothetical protein A2W25_11400 [candidate division Zixibacteria bacterium RBG_16_53_22]|nr:MAG: hypothetical protein A2W25_11400 [candidate division Zixibacteria bacterium RBG_16_53_22]
MSEKTRAIGFGISLSIVGAIFAMLFLASQTARASVVTDLPNDLAAALDISTNLAGMILSMGMIMAVVLVLAVARMPVIGMVITVISLMILLTVMTWLDQLVLIFTGIVTAIYFGLTMKGIWK